jgi:hypothetical protein
LALVTLALYAPDAHRRRGARNADHER